MLSISNAESVDVGDRILAAAASCVRDFGMDRVTLAEIARRDPADLEELRGMPGVGATKLERYGEALLAALHGRGDDAA